MHSSNFLRAKCHKISAGDFVLEIETEKRKIVEHPAQFITADNLYIHLQIICKAFTAKHR